MIVRNRWEIYTFSPPNKDGKMVHFGFCAVSFMIWVGGIVAPSGLPIIRWSFRLKQACQDQQTRYSKITDNACGLISCFSKVSWSVRRTFNQPTDISFFLLDFSFRKDLVHYAAQILLFPVTTELFRHSASDITLPFPLEHHPTLGQKWVRWCEETAITGYIIYFHNIFTS